MKGGFWELREVVIAGDGNLGDFFEGIANCHENVGDPVGGAADAEEVDVGDTNLGVDFGGGVAENGGFPHAAMSVEDHGLGAGIDKPQFFKLANNIFSSNESVTDDWIADRVGIGNRFTNHRL